MTGQHRGRGATAILASLMAVTLVATAILAVIGYRGIRRYTAGRDVSRVFQTLPATPTGLWIMKAADGTLGGIYVVVARSVTQEGGHIVAVPIFASPAEATSPDSFADVYARGGETELVTALESALRLSFDAVLVSSAADVADKVASVVPLTVDLPNDVTASVDGSDVTLQHGEHDLTADEVAAALASPGRGTNASRAGNVAAVLEVLAAKVGAGLVTPATTPAGGTTAPVTGVTDTAELIRRVLAGPIDSKVLGTATAEAADTGESFEIVDIAAAILVFGSIAPANMSTPSAGLNYSLAAPLGHEARVMDAIALILYLGGNVTRVQLTNASAKEETVVYIYAERDKDRLATSNPLFGKVEFGRADTPIEGIDVVVELGKGFLDHAPQRPSPATAGTTAGTAEGG